jgi:hypothetical protein
MRGVPWQNPTSISFGRLDIVAHVPSEPGIYAVMEEGRCLLVGESWNLKARLLDLVNCVSGQPQLTVTFEVCDDDVREARKNALAQELTPSEDDTVPDSRVFPGISLREYLRGPA